MRRLILISFILALGGFPARAQTNTLLADLKQMEAGYQSCLDKGENMLACSRRHYLQSESVLNSVYYQLKSKLPPEKKAALAGEQRQWLKLRDRRFSMIQTEDSGLGGRDSLMYIYHEQATVVKERIRVLIPRI